MLRFIALPGLPKDMFVFEAVSDDTCRPGHTCHPMTAKSERDYGLVRRTKSGAEVIQPGLRQVQRRRQSARREGRRLRHLQFQQPRLAGDGVAG